MNILDYFKGFNSLVFSYPFSVFNLTEGCSSAVLPFPLIVVPEIINCVIM